MNSSIILQTSDLSDGNDLVAHAFNLEPTYTQYNMPSPRTQKGKSIYHGCYRLSNKFNYQYIRGYSDFIPNIFERLIQTQNDINHIPSNIWNKKIFARPCPKTPRHGFIESRIVSGPAELSVLLEEVLKEDPEGEIVLTQFINKATYNAVYSTSGLLSIGPGHDGATAGKKGFSLPVKPDKLYSLSSEIVSQSGLSEKDNVFIEAVFTKTLLNHDYHSPASNSGLYITQVRGGPKVQSSTDYVPKKMIIKKIITPNDDLLAWESQVKKLSPGTVVYGKGHTLASHAAIHCVLNKVPFITSCFPKVGEKIEPSLSKEVPLDYRQFKLGTTLGLTDNRDMRHMFHLSVAILHNWVYIRNSVHASWLLGLSASYLSKIMCALNFGEYRHYTTKRYVKRTSIYKKVIRSKKIGIYMRQAPKVAAAFVDKTKYKAAYGGPKWAKAVKANISIWNSIANIQKYGLTPSRARKLLTLINKSINLIHNNGWLFNKISDNSCLTTLQEYPGLCAFQMSDVIYSCYNKISKIKKLRTVNAIPIIKAKK